MITTRGPRSQHTVCFAPCTHLRKVGGYSPPCNDVAIYRNQAKSFERTGLVDGAYRSAKCFFAVSGAAGNHQEDIAVVRRQPGCVDDLRAVFSVGATRRVCLRARADASRAPAVAGDCTPGGGDCSGRLDATVLSARVNLEACRWQPTGTTHTHVVNGCGCCAVLCALNNRTTGAGVVRTTLSGPLAVSPLFAVEYRLAGSAVDVSVPG